MARSFFNRYAICAAFFSSCCYVLWRFFYRFATRCALPFLKRHNLAIQTHIVDTNFYNMARCIIYQFYRYVFVFICQHSQHLVSFKPFQITRAIDWLWFNSFSVHLYLLSVSCSLQSFPCSIAGIGQGCVVVMAPVFPS